MANPYELGTSPYPPTASPSSAAKFGVFILVLAVIVAGGWFYVSNRDSGDAASEPVADSATPTPSPSPTASPEATAAKGTPKSEPPKDAAASASRPGSGRAARPRAENLAPPPVTSPPQAPPPAQAAAAEPAKPQAPPSLAPERAASVSRPPAPPPDNAIYDSATLDVTPPSLLTPIGTAPIRTNYVPGLATIEVIVGGDGSVEVARAGRPPATVGETLEMMNWLSAAKSWRFGPAVRNGQFVKYRLVVPLSALVSGRGIR